jgi:hypothetical protein
MIFSRPGQYIGKILQMDKIGKATHRDDGRVMNGAIRNGVKSLFIK